MMIAVDENTVSGDENIFLLQEQNLFNYWPKKIGQRKFYIPSKK